MPFRRFAQDDGADEWSQKVSELMDEMQRRKLVDFRQSDKWQPATNVYETRSAYFICVELSGLAADQITIECTDQTRVCIRGHRPQPRLEQVPGTLSVYVLEINEGEFLREIELIEAVDPHAIKVNYDKGYLWISLPKRPPST